MQDFEVVRTDFENFKGFKSRFARHRCGLGVQICKTLWVGSPDLQDVVGWKSRFARRCGLRAQICKTLWVASPNLQDFVGWIGSPDLQDFVGCEDRLARLCGL